MPSWPKLAYTTFVSVLIPVYWVENGPANFLWFSDVALLVTLAALWLEHRLLASAMAVSVLLLEAVWAISFASRLLLGVDPFAMTGYMVDPQTAAITKILSGIFHVGMPATLLWMLARCGYDPRAPWLQTALAWVLLPATYALTEPAQNVNWVHGFGTPPRTPLAPLGHLAALMVLLPVLVYAPTHLVLRRLFPRELG